MDISLLNVEADWHYALSDFREGRPAALAQLMRQLPMPSDVATVLADYIEGKWKIDRPPAAKLTRVQHQKLYLDVLHMNWLLTDMRSADPAKYRMEPIELKRRVAEMRKDWRKVLSEKYGVSEETVRKVRRPTRG